MPLLTKILHFSSISHHSSVPISREVVIINLYIEAEPVGLQHAVRDVLLGSGEQCPGQEVQPGHQPGRQWEEGELPQCWTRVSHLYHQSPSLLLNVLLTLKFCRGQSTVQETQRLPESEEEQRLQDRDHPLPLPPEGDPQEGGHYPGGR